MLLLHKILHRLLQVLHLPFEVLPFYATIISALFVVPILLYVSTYSLTWIKFRLGHLKDHGQRKDALVVPYGIPFLGSAISMATNLQKIFERLASLPEARRPLCIKAGPQRIYLLCGPDNVRQAFNAKGTDQKDRVLELFHNLGMSKDALALVENDESGDQAKPKYDIDPNMRIFRNSAENFTSNLMAPESTRLMAERYVEELTKRFESFRPDETDTVLLLEFLKRELVYASGIALHGELIFEENPDFHEALWGFDDAFPNLLLRLPRWLVPKTYAKSDRLLAQVRKWYRVAIKHNDPRVEQEDHWDRYWGSRFWRTFVRSFIRTGMDLDATAAGSISTIWATHGNAVPGSAWVLMEILSRPKLQADVIEELKRATTSMTPPAFDKSALLELPLLNAVWDEMLRLRVSAVVYREAREDIYISETRIPKGSQMICANVAREDAGLWKQFQSGKSDGYTPFVSGSPRGGARDFDPLRVMNARRMKADRNAPKDERDRAAAALSPYNLFPWGGGSHVCPGRYFAKQEVFYAVAMLLTVFEVEAIGWETFDGKPSRPARPDSARYGIGMLIPDRDLRVKITRRTG